MPKNIPRRLGLRKPTKPQVDWTNPLNRGLIACWPVIPNVAGVPLIKDIVGKRDFTTSSGAISDAKNGGTSIKYNGSTQFSSAPAAKDQFANPTALSISFWVYHNSVQTGRVFAYGNSTTTGGFGVTINSGAGLSFAHGFSTTSLSRVTNAAVTANVWKHCVIIWPGGLTAANVHSFIDTVEPTYATTTDGVGTQPDDSTSVLFMGAASAVPANPFDGAIENIRIWNRVISTSERIRLFREPWAGITDRSENIIYHVGSAGGGVTVALTGNGVTASQGTLGVKNTHAITGNSSTASEGTIKATPTKALTGNSVTAGRGTLAPKITVVLTGNGMTASEGTITASGNVTVAITGNAMAAGRGTLSPSITLALTGNASTAGRGTVAPKTTISLSGNAVTAFEGTLTGSQTGPVTVALTGNQMTAFQGILTPSAPIVIFDTHDGGPKRKKHDDRQKKRTEEERERNERRRQRIIEVFEQVIEGKVSRETNIEQVIEPAVDYAVSRLDVKTDFDFNKWLENLDNAARLLDDYFETDDEEALLLL